VTTLSSDVLVLVSGGRDLCPDPPAWPPDDGRGGGGRWAVGRDLQRWILVSVLRYQRAHHLMTQVVLAITIEHEAFWEMALGMMPNMRRLMPLSPIASGSA